MASASSVALVGAPATRVSSSLIGSSTTAPAPAAAAVCSARMRAAVVRSPTPVSLWLAASRADTAEARRCAALACSRTRPASTPVVRATAQKTIRVSTSVGEPMAKLNFGCRKRKL
ncbi:hypothetical protein D3C72_1988220 [compost metagenome]